jgi:hypothetical protein
MPFLVSEPPPQPVRPTQSAPATRVKVNIGAHRFRGPFGLTCDMDMLRVEE